MGGPQEWLVALSGPAEPEVELVVVPGAGDGPATALGLAGHLPPSWRLSAVCLPGRGPRFGEPLATGPRAVLDAMVGALDALGPAPLLLAGHSLGALWALEAGGRLARPPAMVATIACAPPAPGGPSGLAGPDDSEDRAFLRGLLVAQGLNDAELLEEFVDLAVPLFQADLRLAGRWRAPGRAALACPLISYYGTLDGLPPTPWTRHTTNTARAVSLEGGHHIHQEQPAGLLTDLARRAAVHLNLDRRGPVVLSPGRAGPSAAGRCGSSR